MIVAAHQTMMGPPALPYDAEVEYLESTGTQYVDTGAIMDSSSVFTGEIAVTASGTQFVFGVYETAGILAKQNFTVAAASSGKWIFDRKDINHRISSSVSVSVGTRTTIVAGNDAISVNGVSTSGAAIGSYSSSLSSYLFAWRRPNDSPQVGISKVRVYSCQISASNGTFDFHPVRVGSGSSAVGYLYDRVSGQLFGNAGTGAFTIGPDK